MEPLRSMKPLEKELFKKLESAALSCSDFSPVALMEGGQIASDHWQEEIKKLKKYLSDSNRGAETNMKMSYAFIEREKLLKDRVKGLVEALRFYSNHDDVKCVPKDWSYRKNRGGPSLQEMEVVDISYRASKALNEFNNESEDDDR